MLADQIQEGKTDLSNNMFGFTLYLAGFPLAVIAFPELFKCNIYASMILE